MKKLYHLLMFLMLSTLLVACGASESSSKKEDKKTEEGSEKSKKKTKKEEKSKDKTENDESFDKTEEETDSEKKQSSQNRRPYTLKSYVAIDKDNYSITVDSMEWEEKFQREYLNLTLENKSTDKRYGFQAEPCFVNGVQVGDSMFEFLDAGKKLKMKWPIDYLKEYIDIDITDLEIEFHIYEMNDNTNPEVDTETVHIYPYGEENATKYVYEPKDTDQVLLDNEYCTIICIGAGERYGTDYALKLYFVNKTDKDMVFHIDDVYVNDAMIDPVFPLTIRPQRNTFDLMMWSNSSLKEQGIDPDNVSSVRFIVDTYEPGHLDDEHFFRESVTFTK